MRQNIDVLIFFYGITNEQLNEALQEYFGKKTQEVIRNIYYENIN
jgi:hypothetical protein